MYGAMQSLKDISVRRNLEPISRLRDGKDKTLFVFAGNLSEDPEDVIKTLENFAADGGRLVITFFPVTDELGPLHEDKSKKDKKTDEDKKDEAKKGSKDGTGDGDNNDDSDEEEEQEKEPWFTKMVSIEERWSFSYAFSLPPGIKKSDLLEVAALKQDGPDGLPPKLSWHSTLYFDTLAEPWKVLYSWEGHAVIIERPWARGTIVLCSDSYFLSNEAMREERYPELLAWLVGPSLTVIFDETHFGIQERQGVMTLARKYRLGGPLVVVVMLSLLFIWKNAVSLVPKQASADLGNSARGRDSTAGLVNLLRRSIPAQEILPVCIEEWRRSSMLDPKSTGKQGRIQRVVDREQTLPTGQRNPVKAYRTICAILAERD